MKGRIVIAEDDARQARILSLYLEREGHSVVVAEDGLRAVEEFRRRVPDLLIVDVMMPNLDGHDVCRIVRDESDVPILLLTARSSEDDVLVGLDLGADDYVTKPYRPRELMARVRALLRRHHRNALDSELVEYSDLIIDFGRREVRRGDEIIELTTSEFELLAALVSTPGRVFSRFELLERVMGFDHDSLERTIDVHVRNLRRKLGDDAHDPRYIATVVGAGYRTP
ncbi:MAG: response regulator transcription factor [Acidimicrobiia bacterium]|nr:response regulator transcription factor [Acidimicrobiia bacterium]